MNSVRRISIASAAALCAAALLLCAPPALAQPVPRIKARVIAFDGSQMRLQPLPVSSGADAQTAPPKLRMNAAPATDGPVTVRVLPATRYAVTVPVVLSDFKPGDYAGAAVTQGDRGLRAQELFLYPPSLAGTGEGRFSDGGRLMINGKVTKVSASALSLSYRGAAQDGPVCEGRAGPPAIASPLACTGTAEVTVPDGASLMALSLGNAGMIAPGAVVTVSLARDAQGDYVTPGVVIQGAATVPPPAGDAADENSASGDSKVENPAPAP